MRQLLGGILTLALSVAIPATFGGRFFVVVIWIGVILAAMVLIVTASPVRRRIPWTLHRKKIDDLVKPIVVRDFLRRDLQRALQELNEAKSPTASELRGVASQIAGRLEQVGMKKAARRFEVQLPDNASREDIQQRREQIHMALIRMLLWDNYE